MKLAKISTISAVVMVAMAIARVSSACGTYSVATISSSAGVEYRLYCDAFHFGSFIVTYEGALVFRPHPDQHDINGWGTSWYLAPFLAGAGSTPGFLNSITEGSGGIQANFSGLVANSGGSTYGDWNINGTFTYHSDAQKVTASGNLDVNLSGTLTAADRDLNLEKLSSNYLHNVPRRGGDIGDTGDMKEVIVTYGVEDPHNFVWSPLQGPHYPIDTSTSLGIEVVGQINDVDTQALGNEPIAIARKPTVQLTFSSEAIPLSVGLSWDQSRGQDFAADNIGVNHLVLKKNSAITYMTFNFSMNSVTPDPLCSEDSDCDSIPDTVEISQGTNLYIKDNDVFGNTRLFAMQQYRDFLQREGDPGGIDYWTQQLTGGVLDRAGVVDNFLNSAEFGGRVAPIVRLYLAYFQRLPDYDGLWYWVRQLSRGRSLQAISQAFADSEEFKQRYGSLDCVAFVTLVYRNVLGRDSDPVGLAYWTKQCNDGLSSGEMMLARGEMMLGFSESLEHKSRVNNDVLVVMLYAGLLRRSPEPVGFAYWVEQLQAGKTPRDLINAFLTALEYQQRFLP